MSKRFWLSAFLVAAILTGPAVAQSIVPIDPATVTNGHVYLMENVGANLPDDSANSNNGNLLGSPQVVPGLNGNALQFNGTSDGVHLPDAATINTSTHQNKTVIAVFNCADVSKTTKQVVYEEGGSTRGLNIYVHQGLAYAGAWNRGDYTPDFPGTWLSAPIGSNEWHVVAAVLRDGGAGQADDKFEMWMDGKLIDKGPGGELRSRSDDNAIANVQAQTRVHNAEVLNAGNWFEGIVDEIWILNQALSEAELAALALSRGSAVNPVPDNGATDVVSDIVLAWEAGEFAATHDVYFGTTFADVNDASRADATGILVSQGQTATEFEPAGLEYGQTYYWRVDEVNAAPDNTIFKGETWSFTAEPFAYPVQPVTATAANAQAGMGPENTVNGVGLNAADQHSTLETEMWLSDGSGANWIQYEFDQAYKLDELWVWNSNQLIEAFLGFGAKSVTIEYSADGETWTAVENVPEFAQATATPTYTANTMIDLDGVTAQFVRLTINSNWGGLAAQTGLSEVRFFAIPVQAREPMPADEATEVALNTELNWRPGREATSHTVFLGTDANAVTDGVVAGQTVTGHSYTPASLDFGTEYFWKVDEVGDAGTYPGELWSFTSQEFQAIDDMEGYNDDDNRIYQAWIDGVTTGVSGSTVGYFQAPFAEKTIVHGGRQSMPLAYDNTAAPFYSEAEQEFSTAQNWTGNGADTLNLWVQGVPAAYVEDAGTITMSAGGHDIWDNADDFRFAYKTLNGDGSVVVKVESLINTNNWAKAGVMIRQSLDADSKFVYFIQSFAQGVSMGWRPTTAATCGSATQAGVTAPQWVKLIRKGDVFTAQYSADGTTWTDLKDSAGAVASTTVAMTNPVYIGLCVTSHNAAATTVAVMSEAATTGSVTGGSWQVLAIGDDPQPANDSAGLYVTVEDSSGKKATATNATAVTNAAWTQWSIPLSDLAGVNMAKVKKLTIGVDSRTSPTKGAGMIYVDDIGFGHPAQ